MLYGECIATNRRSPLADSLPTPAPAVAEDVPASSVAQSVSGRESLSPAPTPELAQKPAINLQFLQDARMYHALPTDDVPKAFLASDNRPAPGSSLSDVLQAGHFRLAADAAVRALLQRPPDAADDIFQLLYTRLACLVLVSRPDIAAHEAAPLAAFLARTPPDAYDTIAAIPWDLRLLLVRLQSIAPDGGRRGIMALYALAGEVRANLRQAYVSGDTIAIAAWSERLQDLGLRVCDALVEMGELETATRHLDTLNGVNPDELAYRKALLRIRVGDVTGARQCAASLQSEMKNKEIASLLQISDGDYDRAVKCLQEYMEEYPSHELFAQNVAVALLYTGHITSARDVLEDISSRLPMFPTLLFNLSTIYELCTERGAERKMSLIQQSAAKKPGPESGGWERATFEFKL